MQDKKTPYLLLGLAIMIMALGSVLALVHIGVNSRKAGELHLNMNSRKASVPQRSGYAQDLKRGTRVAAVAAADAMDGFFSGWGAGGATASVSGSSGSGAGESSASGNPPAGYFRKYYDKHFGGEDTSSSGSWEANSGGSDYSGGGGAFSGGGGTFSGSGGTSTAQDLPARGQAGGRQAEQGAAQTATGGTPAAGPTGGQATGSPRGGAYASAPAVAGKASPLTPKGPPPPLFPGQPQGGAAAKASAQRGGGLEGFQNKGGAPNLDGALEGAKTGAGKDFGSKAGGGAAATAAAGAAAGGSAPAPSSPASAGGGGGSGGGASSGGSSGGSAAEGTQTASAGSGYGWWTKSDDGPSQHATPLPGEEDQDLAKAVVSERRNGTEAPYLEAEDHEAAPEETQLKAGAVAEAPQEKDKEKEKKELKPDPADYASLSAERRKELRKEMHSFLKRVENRYGKMTDIHYTSCRQTPEVCEKHELTQNYLTMTTAEGAKLVAGVKYVKERWRRYTIEFKRPQQAPRPQPEEDEEEEEEEEE